MGAEVSSSNDGGSTGLVAELTQPDKDDWLSKHAAACNVSNQEIASLWKKFGELGRNAQGEISGEALATSEKDTSMTKRMLEMMPKSKDNTLTFQTFCNMSRWLADATIEKKVRAVYQCLNKGQPLDLTVLKEILSEIYSDESQEVVERSTKVFMHQVGDKSTNSINEEQFVGWAMQLPKDTIEAIMSFSCSPNEEQNSGSSEVPVDPEATALPSRNDMRTVSRMASQKDWALLANKLGFTQEEVTAIKDEIPDDDKEQIAQMMLLWRQKNDEQATVAVLKQALRASDMTDIVEAMEQSE